MKKRGVMIVIGLLLFLVGLFFPFDTLWINLAINIVAYLLLGYDVLYRAVRNIMHGKIFDENFLMSVATFGAFFIKAYSEAVSVMLFYQIGEFFQDRAVEKSRKSITDLMAITPDHANLIQGENVVVVDPADVNIDDQIIIKPGERIPLDAIVVSGTSTLDTSSLTGEALPREVMVDSPIVSGCINLTSPICARVTALYEDSTVNKVLELVETATNRKSRSEQFIAKFAKVYTPIVVGLAVVIAIIPPLIFPGESFSDWIYRALTFLVVSCPCALVLSIPLSFFGGIGGASRLGILVKGSNYLEMLAKTNLYVFDKTGTLTKGVFKVQEIHAIGLSKEKLLELAAYVESASSHPIALSLRRAYQKEINYLRIGSIQEKGGFGIIAVVDGNTILVGNRKLMLENNIHVNEKESAGTLIHIAIKGKYAGWIRIADEVKSESANVVADLKQNLDSDVVMLTGDKRDVGERVANELKIDRAYTELLPDGKVTQIEKIMVDKQTKGKVAFVGDGINDAAVIARADVGIAMGAMGSDAAIEAADVVIMNDQLSRIPAATRISKKTVRIANENIVMAIGVKVLVLVLSAINLASMWMAIFADVGVSLIAILNASRAMNTKKFMPKSVLR